MFIWLVKFYLCTFFVFGFGPNEKKTVFFVQTKMENENDEYNDMYNKVIPFQCNNNQNVYNYMLNIIFLYIIIVTMDWTILEHRWLLISNDVTVNI